MNLKIGSLCSGYGGLDMGLQLVLGGAVVWHVEYEQAPSRVLAHHWPTVPNHGDLTSIKWSTMPPIDVLTAGYPCQPFSIAGKRKGTEDERHLWPHIKDAVRHLRPRLILLENVRGHLTLGFDRVLGDLAELGYDTRWVCIPASAAGAPHRRERIFIVAEDADRATGDQRRLTASGQAESGRSWSDPGGRGGTSLANPRGDQPERWGIDGIVAGTPGAGEVDREERERDGDAARNRGPIAPHSDSDGLGGIGWVEPVERDTDGSGSADTVWGDYEPAIRRWEHVLGRLAPAPTSPDGRNGQHRLSARFVEWMMGLPEGHVTDVGLTRAQQLKALGNGVVPQQAALALRLLGVSSVG